MNEPIRPSDLRKRRRGLRLRRGLRNALALAAALALGAAGIMLASCGTDAGSDNANAPTQAQAAETRTLTDTEGREVAAPVEPQHVAVMDSFCGELCVMLGAGERLIGVPGGIMSDKVLQTIHPGLQDLQQLAGNAVNVEALVEQGCDVALVKASMPEDERAKLDKVGIPYVMIGYSTLEEQLDAMGIVADALGDDARQAEEKIAAFYRETIDLVDRKTAEIEDADRVAVYHAISGELLCDAAGSLGAAWIERAGGTCVSAAESPTSGSDYNATLEQIYAWDPDVLLFSVVATEQAVLDNSRWQGLPAVAEGKTYRLPIGATRWGHRGSVETPLAMLWFGCTFFPDLYGDVDMESMVRGYYEDCLGVSVDRELYEQMLTGEGIRSGGNGSGQGSGGNGGK